MLTPLRSWGDQRPPRPPLIDAHAVPACVELPNPTFWQRNLSSLKWEYVTQSAVGDKRQAGEG